MSAYALVTLAIALGQPPTASPEAVAIAAAKKAIVRQIDPALPRTTFETWLRGLVRRANGYQVGSERLRGADRRS